MKCIQLQVFFQQFCPLSIDYAGYGRLLNGFGGEGKTSLVPFSISLKIFRITENTVAKSFQKGLSLSEQTPILNGGP